MSGAEVDLESGVQTQRPQAVSDEQAMAVCDQVKPLLVPVIHPRQSLYSTR